MGKFVCGIVIVCLRPKLGNFSKYNVRVQKFKPHVTLRGKLHESRITKKILA